jgi:hypothetical protein
MIRHPLSALIGAVAALALLAACGSDNAKSSSPPVASTTTSIATGTGSPQLCSAFDALKSSIRDLASVDVVKNGTSGVQDAVTKVKDNLQGVKASASDQLRPQVQTFEDSVTALGNAISNVGSGGVAAVATAAASAVRAGQALVTALGSVKC